jgi:N-acetylneuraminic acid mutarotase
MLVVGGTSTAGSAGALASAEIYDPGTGKWSATTDMLHARAYPMVVKLKDGSVLVAGGSIDGVPSDAAERYSPDYGGWMQAGTMHSPRTQGTATLLDDGRVLVAGGGSVGAPTFAATAGAEIYDPTTNSWTVAASMSIPRSLHTATLLDDGEVLVTGGATAYTNSLGAVTASAEIYNPRADAWHAAAPMSQARYIHSATALGNGHVLVVGGWSYTTNFDPSLSTAEIYDPAANRWTETGPMTTGRARFGLVALQDGRLLAAGGVGPTYRMLATAELWDPATGLWHATGSLTAAVMWPAIAELPDGQTLIAGGALDTKAARTTNVCELYSPTPR